MNLLRGRSNEGGKVVGESERQCGEWELWVSEAECYGWEWEADVVSESYGWVRLSVMGESEGW